MVAVSPSQNLNANKALDLLPYKLLAFSTRATDELTLYHWQEEAELIFCVSGSFKVYSSSESYFLGENDFIFIRSNRTQFVVLVLATA